jgi:Flp pilus assembly protein TadB
VDKSLVFGIISILVASGSGLVLFLNLKKDPQKNTFRNLMSSSTDKDDSVSDINVQKDFVATTKQKNQEKLNQLKEQKNKQLKNNKKSQDSLETKFFKAGMFSHKSREDFYRMRYVYCGALGIGTFLLLWLFSDFTLAMLGALLGSAVGFRLPYIGLDRKITHRDEEILYYLPLVIEQIAIGVSSSLDIGPALQMVVSMADERDSHNVVTELVRHVNYYVKSGASLEEALHEVGSMSGHTELNHAFMSLGQVSRHGGEISRQLQELADAVSSQREIKVEERVKKLELVATGPVALVFVGFMIILVAGFFIQIKIGFKT